ncbi:MAG TPA: acyl-CoA dehydrogenase family protein [Acidimicrobiales bacterium]|jgi:alkylation response protein AidB-like acyl-CoA dehydrogenase
MSSVTGEQSRQVAESAREEEWTRPSFAKGLFLGDFQLDLIHPHPRPAPDDRTKGEAFLAELGDFLRSEVDPLEIEREAKIPEQVIKGLVALGALGLKIDESYGGLGLSHLYYNRALALAGSAHSALSSLLSAHQSIGVPEPLHLFGTDEQKRRFLPRVAKSDISAFLLTEPDVGSDPARMGSTAVPTADGSAYLLNGTKLWTTNGVIADLLVVMAVVPPTDEHRGGITAFVVEANSPGITVLHRNEFMGLRGIENGVTRFEDVCVPAENVIGGVGRGLKVALSTLNTGRLSLPAICMSSSKLSLAISRRWANERVQWGVPIGQHEAIAHKLAFMAGLTFAMESVVELSSSLADEERNDIRIEAALAKLYCSEMAWRVADDMVQIRGGRGYETAASLRARGEPAIPAEQILRDLRITRIFEGSSEIMKLMIAREAVDQHLTVAGDLVDPKVSSRAKANSALRAARFYSRWLPSLATGPGQRPKSYQEFGDLAEHLRFVERASRKLARTTFYAMSIWRSDLESKQGFLGHVVDIGAELYAMSAACVRAKMLLADGAEGTNALELAQCFCLGAERRVRQHFHDLWHNDDSANSRTAQRVLDGRYEWAEAGIVDPSLLTPD